MTAVASNELEKEAIYPIKNSTTDEPGLGSAAPGASRKASSHVRIELGFTCKVSDHMILLKLSTKSARWSRTSLGHDAGSA